MRDFQKIRRIVIKIGSTSLTTQEGQMDMPVLRRLMDAISELQKKDYEIIIVTSGAIAAGMSILGFSTKPKEMSLKQACAAVGQAKVMEAYCEAGLQYKVLCGQILVNHDDFDQRQRLVHFTNTIQCMLKHKIVPIINENDALAVEEIRVGDNDTLSALCASTMQADLLILFSDIEGLYTKNPKVYKDAILLSEVTELTEDIMNMAQDTNSNVGTGGMKTKLQAALIATYSDCDMIICSASNLAHLEDIISGEAIGTLFKKSRKSMNAKKHWLLFRAYPKGEIIVDDGCSERLNQQKVSLLPAGISSVVGSFLKNSVVLIKNNKNEALGKGVVNYSSMELLKIKGLDTSKIINELGYMGKQEVIHADQLVLYKEMK